MDHPTLSTGSTGANEVSLRFLLTSRGFSTTADGDFGSGTQAAVTAFQQSRGLGADGVAGPQTFSALVSTVGQGSNGAAVQALQVQLVKHPQFARHRRRLRAGHRQCGTELPVRARSGR